MASRFTPISATSFIDAMSLIEFSRSPLPGTAEMVFERIINNGTQPGRFAVRIFSSITPALGETRECGSDAIRVTLVDRHTGRIAHSLNVHRTQNALLNVRKKARETWRLVLNRRNLCVKCGALLVERKRSDRSGSFIGCSSYPACRHTQAKIAA